ncbi:MAG: rhodanese-like domain-containing protein [Lachnospiraceae bacterium]|nr:rhodanese-like domain-containing protein [Lachnospiraceae bacterium]
MKLIAAGLIDDYLDHGALIVDLRSAEAYQETHIRGAVNIPEEEMENAMSGLPHHRTIVLYCEHGTTSMAVGRKLSHAGFHVASAIGGIRAYRGRYLIR